jgi:hypothetical protein
MFRRALHYITLHQECSRGDTIRGKRWQLMTPCNTGVLLPWKSEVRCEKGGAMLSSLCLLGSLLGHGWRGGWLGADLQHSACVVCCRRGCGREMAGRSRAYRAYRARIQVSYFGPQSRLSRFMCLVECWQGPSGISGGKDGETTQRLNCALQPI